MLVQLNSYRLKGSVEGVNNVLLTTRHITYLEYNAPNDKSDVVIIVIKNDVIEMLDCSKANSVEAKFCGVANMNLTADYDKGVKYLAQS